MGKYETLLKLTDYHSTDFGPHMVRGQLDLASRKMRVHNLENLMAQREQRLRAIIADKSIS